MPNIFVFLELLNVPTIGNRSENRKLFYELVSEAHLAYIEKLMLGGGEKLFFVSNGVLREIAKLKKRYPLFQWLDFKGTDKKQYSKTINENRIKEIYHFSSAQIHSQVSEIYKSINNWLGIPI
jgi:hypothetical protein